MLVFQAHPPAGNSGLFHTVNWTVIVAAATLYANDPDTVICMLSMNRRFQIGSMEVLPAPMLDQLICINEIMGSTYWTCRYRSSWVHHKLISTRETEVRSVIADAQGNPFVVWMVSILLFSIFIEIIRVTIAPYIKGITTFSANTSLSVGHRWSLYSWFFCPLY